MVDVNLEQILLKRKQAQKIMKDMEIPLWVIIVADNQAEAVHLPLIGAPNSSQVAYILTPDKAIALTGHLEAGVLEEYKFDVVQTQGRDVIKPLAKYLETIVSKGTPIRLNYSRKYNNVDTLGHGSFMELSDELIKNGYFIDKEKEKLLPADNLIFTIASEKLPYEIDLLREATQVTNEVLVEIFKEIKSGMTERDVSNLVHRIVDGKIANDSRLGYSWEKETNPIVLTGDGIAGSPHKPPSNRIIEKGYTVYIDFGLSVDGYHGDLQHLGYVLKDGEFNAPSFVENMYSILVKSIEAGQVAARPGALGWQIDKASRDVIIEAGYPSFKHATGHQLGSEATHSPGVSFGPKYMNYSNDDNDINNGGVNTHSQLPIKKGYVMTIEPRIQIPNGASIEVDGVVTENGLELFVPIQKDIHLIR